MGDQHRNQDTRLYAAATWSVPILVALVPAATFVVVGAWGLAGAGAVLAVIVLAALVGARRRGGVVAGLASGVVLSVGISLVGLFLVLVIGAVLS